MIDFTQEQLDTHTIINTTWWLEAVCRAALEAKRMEAENKQKTEVSDGH